MPAYSDTCHHQAPAAKERELAQRLLAIAETMVANRGAGLSSEVIRELPDQVKQMRLWSQADPAQRLVDAEAACVVELMIALAYARDAQDKNRESRMVMFLNSFIPFLQMDLNKVPA